MSKKEMTKKEENLPVACDFENDGNQGFEGTDGDSFAIPFIRIIQKGSPQVDIDHANYDELKIPDAEIGMFVNTADNQLLGGEIKFIPCAFVREFLRWKENNGGLVGKVPPSDPLIFETTRNDKGKDVLPDGTFLEDTRQHYGLLLMEDGRKIPAVVSFTSTQLKKSRKFLTNLKNLTMEGKNGPFTPPTFASVWNLSTVKESNEKGSWRGWKVSFDRFLKLPDEAGIYGEARDFHKLVVSGKVEAATPDQEGVESEDDMPF